VQHGPGRLAVDVRVNERLFIDAIEVIRIVRRILKVPLDRAAVGIQRNDTVCVEVVARPIRVVPVRTRIADTASRGTTPVSAHPSSQRRSFASSDQIADMAGRE
jgi:hypothetical protein